MRRYTAVQKSQAAEILRRLKEAYPDAGCALVHRSPWELLVATILSAQCTDARVNLTTPALFKRFPAPRDLAEANPAEVEELVKSTGFFRQKAASIISMSKDIVARHNGEVPQTLEELTKLRGVGRKTANVLIGVAFGGDGITVDTHVRRISRLLGWTRETDPVKIEQDLMRLFPKHEWTPLGHVVILHGRSVCIANRPRCSECCVADLCRYGRNRNMPSQGEKK